MSLPAGKIGTQDVALSGGAVTVYSLTNAQLRIVSALQGDERVVASISFATRTDKREVAAWVDDDATPASDVVALLNAVASASGLTADAQFRE